MVRIQPIMSPRSSLEGLCSLAGRRYPVAISGLSDRECEARLAEIDAGGWSDDDDFCELTIAGLVTINGKVLGRDGASARIRFYGNIHPVAVAKLLRTPI